MNEQDNFVLTGYGRTAEDAPLTNVDDILLRNAIKRDLLKLFSNVGEQHSVEGIKRCASQVISYVKTFYIGTAEDALKLFLNEYCLYHGYGRNKCRQLIEVLELPYEQTIDKWCYVPALRTEKLF